MSRLIKFRVWDNRNKNWVDGPFEVKFLNNCEYTVEQFTGFKFDNIEVYEGDIIEFVQCLFNTNPENYPIRRKEVKWNDLFGQWTVFDSRAGEINLKVIGNVHENPELLCPSVVNSSGYLRVFLNAS